MNRGPMKKIILIICLCIFVLNGCSNRPNISDSGDSTNDPVSTITSETDSPTPISPSTTPFIPSSSSTPTPTPSDDSEGGKEINQTEPDNNNKESQDSKDNSDNMSPLSGLIICIDPGHGNPDVKGKQEKIAPNSEETKPAYAYGATGTETKIPEYVTNMSVSLKLQSLLKDQNCTVILTRQSDDENLGNIDRAIIGNDANSDLVIRIHADGSENKSANGVSVLYPGDKYISDDEVLVQSKLAAQHVHDEIIKATGAKPRGLVKRDDLTGFNWSTQTTILVEMGFLSNPEEDRRLNDTAYQDKIANGILKGIIKYFEAK